MKKNDKVLKIVLAVVIVFFILKIGGYGTDSRESESTTSYWDEEDYTLETDSVENETIMNSDYNEEEETTEFVPYTKHKNKKNKTDSYDEGYEDVYFDGDYDDDKYNKDEDYANGVDDAIEDDYEEDGCDW